MQFMMTHIYNTLLGLQIYTLFPTNTLIDTLSESIIYMFIKYRDDDFGEIVKFRMGATMHLEGMRSQATLARDTTVEMHIIVAG